MFLLNSLSAMLGSTMLRGWPIRRTKIPGADSLLDGPQPMLKTDTASNKPVLAHALIQHIPLIMPLISGDSQI